VPNEGKKKRRGKRERGEREGTSLLIIPSGKGEKGEKRRKKRKKGVLFVGEA